MSRDCTLRADRSSSRSTSDRTRSANRCATMNAMAGASPIARLERSAGEQRARRRLGGDRRCRMRAAAEERDFAERSAGSLGVNDVLAGAVAAHHAHLALEHDPPAARLAVRQEQHFVRRRA